MTSAPFLQRQFGDYLLVAELSEDALGTVFRALCASDERRFVRLRLLKAEGLSREPIDRLIERQNAATGEPLVHEAIVHRPQLDVAEDIPFMTWDETYGWTLDTMLSRVRTFGIRIPAEYALLIAERIAAALEHVHRTVVDGKPAHHGLLWPGFISISHDAAIRIGGFGLAEGVLPSLSSPRLTAEIAPYLSPEVRGGAETSARADVYCLGVILAELLTGRRPTLDTAAAELRAGDPRSEELGSFLQRCMAPPERRFASAAEAHRALQLMVTGNPFSLYNANLALFLYKLLNPEGQSVAGHSDAESTNPIVKGAMQLQNAAPVETTVTTTQRRRSGDMAPVETPSVSAEPVWESAEAVTAQARSTEEEPVCSLAEIVQAELPAIVEPELRAVAEAPAPAGALAEIAPLEPTLLSEASGGPFTEIVPAESLWLEAGAASAPAAAQHAETPAFFAELASIPGLARKHALELLEQRVSRPVRAMATAWSRPAAALAAAAGLSVGAFLVISQFRTPALGASTRTPGRIATAARVAPEAAPTSIPASVVEVPPATIAVAGLALPDSAGREHAAVRSSAPARPSNPVKTQSRQPAEDLRLRAALARIDADRLNAKEAAGDLFGQGRHSEEEGERLLRQQDYDAAQLAFSRAARLFQQAGEISWEERVRQTNPGAAR